MLMDCSGACAVFIKGRLPMWTSLYKYYKIWTKKKLNFFWWPHNLWAVFAWEPQLPDGRTESLDLWKFWDSFRLDKYSEKQMLNSFKTSRVIHTSQNRYFTVIPWNIAHQGPWQGSLPVAALPTWASHWVEVKFALNLAAARQTSSLADRPSWRLGYVI